jgi:hypothetical protein
MACCNVVQRTKLRVATLYNITSGQSHYPLMWRTKYAYVLLVNHPRVPHALFGFHESGTSQVRDFAVLVYIEEQRVG